MFNQQTHPMCSVSELVTNLISVETQIPSEVLNYFVTNLSEEKGDERLHTFLSEIHDAILQNPSVLQECVNNRTIEQHLLDFANNILKSKHTQSNLMRTNNNGQTYHTLVSRLVAEL
jgi:hypothetical protein